MNDGDVQCHAYVYVPYVLGVLVYSTAVLLPTITVHIVLVAVAVVLCCHAVLVLVMYSVFCILVLVPYETVLLCIL
eukprot:COSAG02_NODE_3602_length_6498_cov_2.647914_4_plen_76_part_00